MRLINGAVNAVLMATLLKPMARLMIGRWRRRIQESPAAAIGAQVEELFEAALVEELAPAIAKATPAEIDEITDVAATSEGRSTFRMLLLAGFVIGLTAATAYGITGLVKRRRQAQAAERELVAVPIEDDATEAIDDAIGAALVEEG